MPGTREDVIEEILGWVEDDGRRQMCWLEAPAGSGKSTIAQTIAERCEEAGILAASFFFSRKVHDQSSTDRFFPTIAFQLLKSTPDLKPLILESFRADPTILDLVLRKQLTGLILDPMKRLPSWVILPPMIVVIDAYDECQDEVLAEEALLLLFETIPKNYPSIKIFITSRPEQYIRTIIEDHLSVTKVIKLSTEYDAAKDIQLFLEQKFSEIYSKYAGRRRLGQPWPAEAEIDVLVQRSANLFIFAATAIQYIGDRHKRPNEQLAKFMSSHKSVQLDTLDQLYHDIFDNLTEETRSIVGILVLLFDPISISGLDQLLADEYGAVEIAVQHIRSVFTVPDSEDKPINPCHLSFREFLTSPHRSKTYAVDEAKYHSTLR